MQPRRAAVQAVHPRTACRPIIISPRASMKTQFKVAHRGIERRGTENLRKLQKGSIVNYNSEEH